ncbi:MAG: response regulator [Spirochaetes bacterium]|nr:response regulator [Spirochaetota bacterium]
MTSDGNPAGLDGRADGAEHTVSDAEFGLRKILLARGEEIGRLRALLAESESERRRLADEILRDPRTGYYGASVFAKHLSEAIMFARDLGGSGFVVAAELAGIDSISNSFGAASAEDAVARAASFLRGFFPGDSLAFRLGPVRFAWTLLGSDAGAAAGIANRARLGLFEADIFEAKVTGAFAMLDLSEFVSLRGSPADAAADAAERVVELLAAARASGGERVESGVETLEEIGGLPLACVVEPDSWHAAALVERLRANGWEVERFADGETAWESILRMKPDVVISELDVPRLDGFALRRAMRSDSGLHDVPYVLVADIKNDSAIREAASLGILWYFKKPYHMAELEGVVSALAEGIRRLS